MMEDLRNLPENNDEIISRFFEMLTVNEHNVLRERRRSSLIPPSHDKFELMEELPIHRSRISSREKLDLIEPDVIELRHAQPIIHLSQRERAKLNAVSKLYPGQIHNIPFNDEIVLPAIKTDVEKKKENRYRFSKEGMSTDKRSSTNPNRVSEATSTNVQKRQTFLLDANESNPQMIQKLSSSTDEILSRSISQQFEPVEMNKVAFGTREQVPVTKAIARNRQQKKNTADRV